MPESFTEKTKFDPAARAERVLDAVLDDSSKVTQEARKNSGDIDEELRREQLLKEESDRIQSRVLFITREVSALEKESSLQQYYIGLADVFDEVHVIVLGLHKTNTKVQRLVPSVWVYPTESKYFLQQPYTAYKTAKRELLFTDGFRPDIVVAQDPFESGVSGYVIARHFKRSLQIHVTEDFYTPSFKKAVEYNSVRLHFAHWVLKRVASVRVQTGSIKKALNERFKNLTDVALLPRYFHIQEILQRVRNGKVSELYPQFSFTILFIGELNADSTLFRAIDAVRMLLKTPSIGMVVIGDGPLREEFQERARLLGIDNQILFKKNVSDVIPHMQSADVLLCTDVTSGSEQIVIQAAAAKLPLIVAHTTLRDDLFTDGEDSFLCDAYDTLEFSQKLVKFLNANALRTQFAQNAQEVVRTRIEESPLLYYRAMRDSIESVLFEKAQQKEKSTSALVKKKIKKKFPSILKDEGQGSV